MDNKFESGDYPGWVSEAVRFSETDMLGHVNNTVFGTYFEIGRSTWFSESGFYGRSAFTLVIVKCTIEFLGMIYWPGSVRIGTRMAGAGRSSFSMEQVLEQNGQLVGRAHSTMVLIDTATNKSTPMPAEIRSILGV